MAPLAFPKFGAGYTGGNQVATEHKAGIQAVDAAFNNLITVVKQNCLPGNTMLLWFFGASVKGLYSIAHSLVSERPVINA